MFRKYTKYIFWLVLAGVLTACGGSGSNTDADGTLTAGNREVSTGTITGFGSVYVNGTRYDTSSASVKSDDSILNDVTELKIGMKASVTSDSTNQKASDVKYEEDVKGPADAEITDFKAAAFSVMGQMVTADDATIIDNSLSLPVNAGDILEISGIRQADDSILATYIEGKNPANVSKYKVIGTARATNTGDKKFMIGDLQIDYSGANVGDLSNGNPTDGQLLEVKDEKVAYVAGSKMLMATKVEPFDTFTGNGDDSTQVQNVEIETAVIGITTPGEQFQIPNFTVNIDPATTTFRYGTADEIGVGTVLQVKAVKNDSGELDASRITFKRNSTRMQASVDVGGVNKDDNQLTVAGVTVQLNAGTEMKDSGDKLPTFTIDEISDNDYLKIRGFTSVNDTFIATRLERDKADDRVEIRGIVSNIVVGTDSTPSSLDILGITITAGSATKFNDGASTSEAFFAALTDGLSIVKVRWDPFVDTASAPRQMENEDDF